MRLADRLRVAQDDLRDAYLAQIPAENPPKQSIPLHTDANGIVQAYANVMGARVGDHVGTKLVIVDEEAGTMTARTLVFDRWGTLVRNVESATLTALRCGMMAGLAAEFFYGRELLDRSTKVGLIGIGQLNIWTAHVFRHLYGVERFWIKGSPRHPMKNAEWLVNCDTVLATEADLRGCDVVISATNVPDQGESLSYERIGGAELFIAQDGGWLLDRSFRAHLPSFTDNVDQLRGHWDDEFPGERIPTLLSLDAPALRVAPRAAVYLYGVALADIVVALRFGDPAQPLTLTEMCRP